jgi:hypothetical protein
MSEVLVWARRWARRPEAADHELLEVTAAATLEIVRTAYHKLARFAHPDLHRAALDAAELEEVTETFARVSNAYSMMTARLRKEGASKETAAPPTRPGMTARTTATGTSAPRPTGVAATRPVPTAAAPSSARARESPGASPLTQAPPAASSSPGRRERRARHAR